MDSFATQNKKPEGVDEREVVAGPSRASVDDVREINSRTHSREDIRERDLSPVVSLTRLGPGSEEGSPATGLRTRSGRMLPPAPIVSDDGEDSDCSFVSLQSGQGSRSSSKKRGRPPTTGDYVGLAEAKRRFVEAHEAEMEVREVEAILDPTIPPRRPGKGSMPLPDETEIAREYRHRPTADVASLVYEFMDEVLKVASVSKGLKGPYVRALRLAALKTRTGVMELASRSASDATRVLEAENNSLRGQMEELRKEVARLRAAVDTGPLRPRTPPPRQPLASRMEASRMEAVRAVPGPAAPTQQAPRAVSPVSHPPAIVRKVEPLGEGFLERIGSLIDAKLASFKREQSIRVEPSSTDAPAKKASRANQRKRRRQRQAAAKAAAATAKETTQPPEVVTGSEDPKRDKTAQATGGELWSKVVGRGERREAAAKAAASAPKPPVKASAKQGPSCSGKGKQGPVKGPGRNPLPPRPPRMAAVTVTVPTGGNMSYAEAMATARAKVNLAEVGIASLKVRKGVTGALVLEVPGPDGAAKADTLAAKMSAALDGTGVKIARPMKRAELRVRGLDDSATPKEVAAAVAAAGECRPEEVVTGEIRTSSSGMGTIWVRCPAAAARKLAQARKVTVGWTQATVEALQARPLQCYRCLEMGHTRARCTAETDRSGRCYICGDLGHKAGTCKAPPKCPVCADQGKPAGHRLGSRACKASSGTKAGRKGGKTVGAKAAAPAATVAQGTPATVKEVVAVKPPVAAQAATTGMDTTA